MHGNMMIFDPDLPHNHLHFSMFFAHSATINVLYIRSRVRRKNMLLSQFLSTSDNKGGFGAGAGGGGGAKGQSPPPPPWPKIRQAILCVYCNTFNKY